MSTHPFVTGALQPPTVLGGADTGDKVFVDSYTVRPATERDPPDRVVSSTAGPVVIELDEPEGEKE